MVGFLGQAQGLCCLASPACRPPLDLPSRAPGRPPLETSLRALILRFAHENPQSGIPADVGELKGVGIAVSATSVRKVLIEARLGPAPERGSSSWRAFLRSEAADMVVCDLSVAGQGRRCRFGWSSGVLGLLSSVPRERPDLSWCSELVLRRRDG